MMTQNTSICATLILALLLLAPPAHAIEAELIDTEYIILNTNTDNANSTILDSSTSPMQQDPSTESYIIDTEYSITNTITSRASTTVLDSSTSPLQPNPSTESYIIDTEYTISNTGTTIPTSSALDYQNSPLQLNPSSNAYIIDAEYTITDIPSLTPWHEDESNIYRPPIASFTHNTDGLKAEFTSTSHDPDGIIVRYYWDFGDRKTSTSQNPTYTYRAAAQYPVTLIVEDNEGYKASRTETITIQPIRLKKVVHPSEIPIDADLSVKVETTTLADITLDLGPVHKSVYGKDAEFSIDTSALTPGTYLLKITAYEDTYEAGVIIYNPIVFQKIAKGLDDLYTISKNENQEIAGKTGYAITHHTYDTIDLELTDNLSARDMFDALRNRMQEISDTFKEQLETFKNILKTISPEADDYSYDMNNTADMIANIQDSIDEANYQLTDENIIDSFNNDVTTPLINRIVTSDEEHMISNRTAIAKASMSEKDYTQAQLEDIDEIINLGKEAIANTDDEEIYRLELGTPLGNLATINPTLDYFSEKHEEALEPPEGICLLFACIPWASPAYPKWLYHITIANAESILTVPAAIGMIPATPVDETIQPTYGIMAIPAIPFIAAAATAIKSYVLLAPTISPGVIEGGMIFSTDLLSREINEEHSDIINAMASTTSSSATLSLAQTTAYTENGDIIVTTTPDGKITDFRYVTSVQPYTAPKNVRLTSLNTGLTKTLAAETQNIAMTITQDKQDYSINETANITLSITSDTYIEDAMIWLFIPEENTTIKNLLNITTGATTKTYNVTILAETLHIPRAYLATFGTMIASNHTSFTVNSKSRESAVIDIYYDELYNPGTINIRAQIHNVGNTTLTPQLHYFSDTQNLSGSTTIELISPGETTTKYLEFIMTTPGTYDMYFILNTSTGILDYNTASFTVTAIDTLLAFPSTDKPLYDLGETVNITVTVKNVALAPVDIPYSLIITSPSGDTTSENIFTPAYNGTYIVKAKPVAEGYYNIEGETIFLVEKQSDLIISTETLGNTTRIYIKTNLNGTVENADVTINGQESKTDQNGQATYISANETVLLIHAEKFGFNPAITILNFSQGNDTPPTPTPEYLDIIPLSIEILPGDTDYSTAKVTPAGEHPLEIRSDICKDVENDGLCDEIIYNPDSEISVLFEDTDDLTTTTPSDGESRIIITLNQSAARGARYTYYVRTNTTDWKEAYVLVPPDDGAIPEFPLSFIMPILIVLYISGKHYHAP